MRVLVTGKNGQLGYDVLKELNKRNVECIGCDIDDFDITNYNESKNFIFTFRPDFIIHCAAYTNVEKAEEQINLCTNINILGSENIAKICKEIDATMIYISSDYVFDGTKITSYTEEDLPNPLNIYGKSKLDGEEVVKTILEKYFIVRTSWVFGSNGGNFVKTMLRLAENNKELNVVCDQIGSPTYMVDLAKAICDMLSIKTYGTYHITNEDTCSWAQFAEFIFSVSKNKIKVNSVLSSEYVTKATRPKNSTLDKTKFYKLGLNKLPTWENALQRYIKEIK